MSPSKPVVVASPVVETDQVIAGERVVLDEGAFLGRRLPELASLRSCEQASSCHAFLRVENFGPGRMVVGLAAAQPRALAAYVALNHFSCAGPTRRSQIERSGAVA